MADQKFSDPEIVSRLLSYAAKAGFRQAEIDSLKNDARMVDLAHKAMCYEEGSAAKQQAAYMDGGMVQGPGTGTSDSITATSREPGGSNIQYSNGEFVIPKDVVDFVGRDVLQSIIDSAHSKV